MRKTTWGEIDIGIKGPGFFFSISGFSSYVIVIPSLLCVLVFCLQTPDGSRHQLTSNGVIRVMSRLPSLEPAECCHSLKDSPSHRETGKEGRWVVSFPPSQPALQLPNESFSTWNRHSGGQFSQRRLKTESGPHMFSRNLRLFGLEKCLGDRLVIAFILGRNVPGSIPR